ncbi:MAG TPA: hypothetical protein VFZ34_28315, partial [Blastocatellia bacterium]|nr:hypothetical protein [Blastocatellia bacterium]
ETLLVKHPATDVPLGWTPDGKRFLFASDRTGSIGAWMLSFANGKAQGAPELVRPEMGMLFPMAFTNDSSFFFGLRTGMQDVYSVTMDWATNKPLAAPAAVSQQYMGANTSPDWSPDGKSLAWITRRGIMVGEMGQQSLSIHSFETGKTREIKLKLKFFDRPRWSPDGRFVLLYATDQKSANGLYRVDVKTGETTAISLREMNANHQQATWAVDGKAILFQQSDFTNKRTRLIAKDIDSGEEREIYSVNQIWGASHLAPSPDGEQIAFIVYDQAAKISTVKLVPYRGGEARDLLVERHDPKDLTFFYGLAWMTDGRALLLTKGNSRNNEPNAELWRVPIAGGAIQKFTWPMERVRDLRIHPDGKRLAFTSGNQTFEVWAMENLPPLSPARQNRVSRR